MFQYNYIYYKPKTREKNQKGDKCNDQSQCQYHCYHSTSAHTGITYPASCTISHDRWLYSPRANNLNDVADVTKMAALSVSDISNINTRMRAPGTTTFDHRRWAPPAHPFDPSSPSPPLVLHIEFYKLDHLLNIFRENILYFFISRPYSHNYVPGTI